MYLEIIRDPLWNNIRIDRPTLALADTPEFQRLRYVRQLGWAYLVYPGATHTRFEHALGTYHLARRALAALAERGELDRLDQAERSIVLAAALLHDIGHYPFSHALEEMGALHHEEVARPLLTQGSLAERLREQLGPGAPERIHDLIRGRSSSPLQRLISGSLDLDKIEYLKRDALMCGVPYGEVDVDRLLDSFVIVDDPVSGDPCIGIIEKGLSALESLLFAKYQMYRNVYWHHAVRSATVMYKRLVEEAIVAGSLDARSLAGFTDEGLLHHVEGRSPSPLLTALRERRLYKRALEIPAAELSDHAVGEYNRGGGRGEWIADDHALAARVEDRLAAEFGLARGELLLDYPAKTQMLGLDIPVRQRNGAVRRLTAAGWEGAINLPALSEQLYRSARWLRVFVAREVRIPPDRLLALAAAPAESVRKLLDADSERALLD
ncbi:MAG: HD domain-containing protein [Gemmatimonadaceae bacterium]